MEQSRERSKGPPLHLGVVAIGKGAFKFNTHTNDIKIRKHKHVPTTRNTCIVLFGLVWFDGISTIVGYLMPNLLHTYILNI